MQVLERDFQSRSIVKHVHTSFPDLCARMGRRTTAGKVKAAIEKAGSFGFTAHMDVQQFVDLVVVLGGNFWETPEFSWTQEVLNDPSPSRRAFRATWLADRVIQHLMEKEEASLAVI
jgi:hypothetical protein